MSALDAAIPDEEWRVVDKWPSYQVSNLGRASGPRGLLRPYKDRYGYLRIGVGKTSALLHRLVAEAFIGPCPPSSEVAHKDHDRANPRLGNLEFLTHADNVKATAAAGRSMRGETHVCATISEATARQILADHAALEPSVRPNRSVGLTGLARRHGTTLSVVCKIIHGQTWRHLSRPGASQPISTEPTDG